MRIFFAILIFISGNRVFSQEHIAETEKHLIGIKAKDSTCLKDCFLKADWEAHTRSFFMHTINRGSLKDDYALAAGAGIGVLTYPVKGFQVGVSGFFIYNLASSHIEEKDPLTNSDNRYEQGLFDLENPGNKNDLDRLEELYLKYNFKKSAVTIGKVHLNTPFINPQDGRMRPTVTEGVWLNIHESKKIGFNGGWIWEISPRSTVRWYTLSQSMGVYPSGITTEGLKSDYFGNVQSKGMALANFYYQPTNKLKVNLWNAYLENVMNTGFIEIQNEISLSNNFTFFQGIQFMHQNAVNNGGNIDQLKTYINKNAQSNVISLQAGLKNNKINTSLNYTHITGDGRYLMPREWGKEPFYTFLPRERNEGFGNVHAFVWKSSFDSKNKRFKTGIGYGYYNLPDVKNYRLNKYGMPSYHQINADASYNFTRFLNGLSLKLLVVGKFNNGNTYDNLKYVYNKVDLMNFNLIIDFKL